jgi:hypothetical protein
MCRRNLKPAPSTPARRKGADNGRNHEADHHRRTGLVGSLCSENEDSRADDRAYTEHGELESTQCTRERFLFSRCKNRVERFNPIKDHSFES